MTVRNSAIACRWLALLCGGSGCLATGPALAGSYVYSEITIPGADIRAVALNTKGLAVANATDQGTGEARPLTYASGMPMVFNPPDAGATFSYAAGVNDRGQIAADYIDAGGRYRAFIHAAGSGKNKKLNGPGNVVPIGIDKAGEVAASAFVGKPAVQHGVYLSASGSATIFDPPGANQTQPYAISDSGIVGGQFSDHGNTQVHGFTYANGVATVIDVPNATYTGVWGVNDSGDVGGAYTDTSGVTHGFTKVGGTFRTYDYPGAASTKVLAILPAGQVIGQWYDSGAGSHGFNYVGGNYYDLEPTGAVVTSLGGINRQGNFAVVSIDGAGAVHGWVVVCPAGQAPCTH